MVGAAASAVSCLEYSVDNLLTPKRAVLGDWSRELGSLFYGVFDVKSRALVFAFKRKDGQFGEVWAYDRNGLHAGTDRHRERFRSRAEQKELRWYWEHQGKYDIRVREVERNRKLERVLSFVGIRLKPRQELQFKKRAIRQTTRRIRGFGSMDDAVWDEDLGLILWREVDSQGREYIYYADENGHYRQWFRGTFLMKVRRWKGENE